jgi:hypothetical protein
MVIMRCADREEMPGTRPLLYGIRPNEDLAIFNEGAVAAEPPSTRGGVKAREPPSTQAGTKAQKRTAQSSAEGEVCSCGSAAPGSGGGGGGGRPAESHLPPKPEGRPVSWTAVAEEQKLNPFLFFSARGLVGQACSLSPGVAPQVWYGQQGCNGIGRAHVSRGSINGQLPWSVMTHVTCPIPGSHSQKD